MLKRIGGELYTFPKNSNKTNTTDPKIQITL